MPLKFLILAVGFLTSCSHGDFKASSLGERTNVVEASGQKAVTLMDFSSPISLDPTPPGWHHMTFRFTDPMKLTFPKKGNSRALKCEVNDAASMLFRHIDISLDQYPILSWKWMVKKNVASAVDEKTAKGDDSAARLYVSFAVEGENPRRMELIWGRQLKRGDKKYPHDFNHFVVRGAGDSTGRWYTENLNLKKIYESFWKDKKPARIDLISILCDTDNTGGSAVAYFSDIKSKKSNPSN